VEELRALAAALGAQEASAEVVSEGEAAEVEALVAVGLAAGSADPAVPVRWQALPSEIVDAARKPSTVKPHSP
jgi:hypothetical protein